jgi:hypothetical protein
MTKILFAMQVSFYFSKKNITKAVIKKGGFPLDKKGIFLCENASNS